MPAEALSSNPVVAVVDVMEFRRALVVHFLTTWAADRKLELLSFAPEQAHASLRDSSACRLIIFNAGAASCASPDTISEIRILRALAPSTPLVVLVDEEVPDDVVIVLQSGAEGYLSNQSTPDLVLRALSFVLEGGTYFPRSAVTFHPFPGGASLNSVTEASSAEPHTALSAFSAFTAEQSLVDSHLSELSERQRAILERLCRGEPNKIIGRALNLPESTVKVHVREIMRKLSVSNRTQVAVVVSRIGSTPVDTHGDYWQGGEPLNAKSKQQAPPICPEAPAELPKPCATNGRPHNGFASQKNPRVEQPPARAIPLAVARRGIDD